MKGNHFFRNLFWVLVILVTAFITYMVLKVCSLISSDPEFPSFMGVFFTLALLFVVGAIAGCAAFVYRDAQKNGMNQWMWVTIATFTPNFIGLVLYFIARSNNYNTICLNCKGKVKSDMEVCPYCKSNLNKRCDKCGKKVNFDWKLCPYCKSDL